VGGERHEHSASAIGPPEGDDARLVDDWLGAKPAHGHGKIIRGVSVGHGGLGAALEASAPQIVDEQDEVPLASELLGDSLVGLRCEGWREAAAAGEKSDGRVRPGAVRSEDTIAAVRALG
jgi:hypothetical protein